MDEEPIEPRGAKRRRSFRLVLVALVLAALALPTGASADADADARPDHLVQAGALAADPLKMYEYQDYFPRHLQVHRGDRVRWEFPMRSSENLAFHTVTFAKSAQDVPLVRTDEAPGELAFEQTAFLSTGCGRPAQPVCVISKADQVVSSGTPALHRTAEGGIETFDAVIDLPPGTYHYFCTIHDPVMRGTIEVLPDRARLNNPRPKQLAAEIGKLTAEADALAARLAKPTAVDEGNRRVWTVHAGARTRARGGVHLPGFYPASLRIAAGDAVRWVAGDSLHGVTFPDTGSQLPSSFFSLSCETDAPAGGAPGVPLVGVLEVVGPGCPAGSVPEVVLTAAARVPVLAPGGAVTSPLTVHSSGILAYATAPDRLRGRPAGSGQHWPASFEASFPLAFLDSVAYRCQVHQDIMGGSITVEGA
jgi:plastocyanin